MYYCTDDGNDHEWVIYYINGLGVWSRCTQCQTTKLEEDCDE